MKKKKKTEEVKLQALQFPDERGGLTARLSHTAIPLLAAQFVQLFKDMGGVNYLEFTMTSKKDPEFGPFTVMIQRHNGKTSAEKAGAFKAALEEIVKLHQESNGADFSPAMVRVAEAALKNASSPEAVK